MDQIVRLEKSSGIVIANIEAIVMDEGLEAMDRSERIPAMNLPIGLGDQSRRYYYHAKLNDENIVMHELKETPGWTEGRQDPDEHGLGRLRRPGPDGYTGRGA